MSSNINASISETPSSSNLTSHQRCTKCRKTLPLSLFAVKRSGDRQQDFLKTCQPCKLKSSMWRKNRDKGEDKENTLATAAPRARADEDDFVGTSEISVETFLKVLAEHAGSMHVSARVELAGLKAGDGLEGTACGKQTADKLAEMVWNETQYRFTYHSKYKSMRDGGTRFMYHCAQSKDRQKESKKILDDAKQRDKEAMITFDCKGWLFITISDSSSIAMVKVVHSEAHVPYCTISVPEDVKGFIRKHSSLTTSQLWKEILKQYPNPAFSRKAIHHLWEDIDSKKWKRSDDEVQSAQSLLEELANSAIEGSPGSVDPIYLEQEAGHIALAFALPKHLDKWAGRIRELSIDSAWNTNGASFELYALLGETYGKGLPIGYLLIRSDGTGHQGAKERLITQFLRYIKQTWNIHATFTHSDKDQSEINAMGSIFTDAKHQLCFWHCMRAIKMRLKILRRTPGYYNVVEAQKEFNWIDKDFVPIGQMDAKSQILVPPASQQMIPQLRIRLGGVLQTISAPQQERLTIRVPPLRDRTNINPSEASFVGQEVEELYAGNKERSGLESNDTGDVLGHLDSWLDQDKNDSDSEDAPDWEFDANEVRSKDPAYVFCPAAHRHQLLRLFAKHFCMHPAFPEESKGFMTAVEIRTQAVLELYTFCHQRSLREVWGYMWTQWYSPKKWKIWARSTSKYVSRLRTTMSVENHWRQLKHDHLHHLLRPRLDQLIYILVMEVTPAYLARAQLLEDNRNIGRTKALTSNQQYFKRCWISLSKKPVSGTDYFTNVKMWTCHCGQQKYNCHHLCKHLVHAVHAPRSTFFHYAYQRRTSPLYRHPWLQPKDSSLYGPATEALLDKGSVTDGDDHIWLGDESELGGNGSWRTIISRTTDDLLQKRQRDSEDNEQVSTADEDTPVVFHLEDSDEETERSFEFLKQLEDDLRKAADIVSQQRRLRNATWARRMAKSEVGKEVSALVNAVQWLEKTGRVRNTTWARNPQEARRTKYLMAYLPSSSPPASRAPSPL